VGHHHWIPIAHALVPLSLVHAVVHDSLSQEISVYLHLGDAHELALTATPPVLGSGQNSKDEVHPHYNIGGAAEEIRLTPGIAGNDC